MTNVALRANLSYDRLMGYLDHLAQAGLVTRDRMPRLTEKGRAFLREYRQWSTVLERFGLDRPEPEALFPGPRAAGRAQAPPPPDDEPGPGGPG